MISVIVPTYNHAAALPGLFDSLRRQGRRAFEVIVVDDGSTDETAATVRQYVRTYGAASRIRYLRVPHAGASAARNAGAREAKGQYLLFADADLVLHPEALQRLQQALEATPAASYAYGSFRFGWKLFRGQPFDAAALRRGNYIHTSALIRREHFTGFDERLERFQDWDLWLTMLEQGHRGVFVPDELFRARVVRAGISTWRPRLWYRCCRWVEAATGWVPPRYRRYVEARAVVARKHGLP